MLEVIFKRKYIQHSIMNWKYFQLGLPKTAPEPGSWTELCSRGGLTGAKEEIIDQVRRMDLAFNRFHGYGSRLQDTPDIIKRTEEYIMEFVKEGQRKMVSYFVKMKFFYRIRCINEMDLLMKKEDRKRKAEQRGENFKRLKTMRDFTKSGHFSSA